MSDVEIKETIRERYGEIARRVGGPPAGIGCCGASAAPEPAAAKVSCCGPAPAGTSSGCDPVSRDLYGADETSQLPAEAVTASLGCGNPTALVTLREGETVLDLGSGGGIDVLLSAKRVGPTGKAYGLDMTDEMLQLARANARKAGATNAEFLKGEIEAIPLPDASVDVIISNCVINLSPDKPRALAEAFRVLKPGGRFAVSDIVFRGVMPAHVKRSVELWVGCVAGAMEEREYIARLEEAGFQDVTVEPTRIYRADDAREILTGSTLDVASVADEVDGKFMSAFVRATKPSVS